MNKKIMIWAIALVGISTLIVQQANAASMMWKEKHWGPENMNRSGTYTGMHLGSGRNEMWSGLKLWSWEREHFGSGDIMWSGLKLWSWEKKIFGSGDMMWSGDKEHFGSGFKLGSGFHFGSGGNMMWSGEKKDFLGTGTNINPGKKIWTIKKATTIKKAIKKTSKKTTKK